MIATFIVSRHERTRSAVAVESGRNWNLRGSVGIGGGALLDADVDGLQGTDNVIIRRRGEA